MNPLMSLWAAVAVLGFAMIFSVPRSTLPGIAVLAVVAHLTRSVVLAWGAALPLASLVAALLIGTTATVVGPRTSQAKPIYAFAPVIPLIPGTYMFDALSDLLSLASADPAAANALVDTAIVSGVTATLTIISLAVGAIGPTLLAGQHIARLVTTVLGPVTADADELDPGDDAGEDEATSP